MIQIALYRNQSGNIAHSDVRQWERGDTSHGWQDKSPDIRRGRVVGWIEGFALGNRGPASAYIVKLNEFNAPSAVGHRCVDVDRHDHAGR